MYSTIILVNKPRGISSNTVVNIVKRVVGAKKAGHLGTLDVAGEGLLPVTIEKATKLFDYYLNKDKVYKTVFKFGETTDTLDLEGKVIARDNKIITKEALLNVIPSLIGRYPQMPPQFSAKKIGGVKAYDLARQGKEAKLKPKEIEVYNIKLLKQLSINEFELEIHCSSGTYIRSICRDLAIKLSTYGVMYSILRTKCGEFDIKDSFTLEDIKQGKFSTISLETLFNLPKIQVSEIEKDKLLNGIYIKLDCKESEINCFYKDNYLGVLEKIEENYKFKHRFV